MFYHSTSGNTLTGDQVAGLFGFKPEQSSNETLEYYGLYKVEEKPAPQNPFHYYTPKISFTGNKAFQTWESSWVEIDEAKLTARLKAQRAFEDGLERIRSNHYLSEIVFNLVLSGHLDCEPEVRASFLEITSALENFFKSLKEASNTKEVEDLLDSLTFE